MHKKTSIINIGLQDFIKGFKDNDARFLHVDWKPPAQGDVELTDILFDLAVNFCDEQGNSLVERANQEAFQKILQGKPVLKAVLPAHECIPDLNRNTLLHAGPPVTWVNMCGAMRGAMLGALVYEGLAASLAEAEALMDAGKIFYGPTYPHGAVAPMTGVLSYSMPLLVVQNDTFGNYSYSPLSEGIGQVLRFGANTPYVIAQLQWMERVLAPVLHAAIQRVGGVNLKNIMAQALSMGDEMHQRNIAASFLFYKTLCIEILELSPKKQTSFEIMDFMVKGNDQFFLNIAMAACRAMIDPAKNIPFCSVITGMSRNGVDFGITLSALGDTWITAPSPKVNALYFPGFTEDDASPDMGDSAIVECCGLGGFAMGASPAVAKFVGMERPEGAAEHSRNMSRICVGKNHDLPFPTMNFVGAPTGIDICKVVTTGILPIINSGVAHKHGGIGQVGAGVTAPPIELMYTSLKNFYEHCLAQKAKTEII